MQSPLTLVLVVGVSCFAISSCQDIDCKDYDADKLDPKDDSHYCRYLIDVGRRPEVGDVCLAHPEDVLPTQAAFGEVDAKCVERKLEKYSQRADDKLKEYLVKHQAPAVLGPNGTVYITDHHHLSIALLRAFLHYKKPYHHRTLYVCITHDFSQLEPPVFWSGMQEKALVFLQDNFGNKITEDQLPTSVKYLRDDPYRTLAMYARESFGFVKCGRSDTKHFEQCEGGKLEAKPFIEFRWGNIYRSRFPSKGIYTESDQMQVLAFQGYLKDVVRFSLDPENKDLEGFNLEPRKAKMVVLDEHGCVVEDSSDDSESDSESSSDDSDSESDSDSSGDDSDFDSDSDSDSDFEAVGTVVVETSNWFTSFSSAT